MNTAILTRPGLVSRLRLAHYNATLTEVIPVHSDLRRLRVVPDCGVPPLEAGQFLTLGLGNWEPRVEGVDSEHLTGPQTQRLTKRAYSVSCSLLDEHGAVRRLAEFPYLEFYVVLVRHAAKHPPALTPRLFALRPGDRLFVEQHAAGSYTLRGVQPGDDVWFFATGTGEAPHNAMIAELLARGHRGRIVSVVSVRHLADAAYRRQHTALAERHPNYRYVIVTTREPAASASGAVLYFGQCHLQDLIATGELERRCAVPLDPARSHVFLCGSPAMIGAQHGATDGQAFAPGSMLDLLTRRGFSDRAGAPSPNVHYERYW